MNSKILLVLCLVGFIALISASEMLENSNVPHDRVRRQWGYGGYGMGMYRPYGMMGMYRPYGMMGMYRPYGMMGMFG
uniref:Uncharacterized protein n=1 Tax=Panagrolaimus sp. ES5 TaxID=591445 RepID=A0AC34FLR8_9BILA